MKKVLLILTIALAGCSNTPKTLDASAIPTQEVRVDPSALESCKRYQKFENRKYSEAEVVDYIVDLYGVIDECADKHGILGTAIKALNIKPTLTQPK